MMKDYKINFVNNTIELTRKFYEATQEYGTPEFKTISDVLNQFPNMRVVVRTSRNTGYKNPYKGLTYDFMRRFIVTLDEENIATFEKTINHYEKIYTDTTKVYNLVRDWFLEMYPNYNDLIIDSTPAYIQKIA